MKYRFIKHLFSICSIILLLTSLEVSAQYANGWIDYSKTYWKFKVGSEGIIRLTKADLDAAGLPSTINGADLVLYRGGKEVSLFTTTVGSLAASDYIEFYGTANDGVLDKELYLKPNKYTNENISLFNDSASYFLTIDNSNPHLRLVNSTVAIPPSPPTAAGYCWANIISNGRNQFSNGKTNGPLRYDISGIVELYASQFDYAEGYIFNWNLTANPASITIATPNLVSTAANARLRTASLAIAKDSNHKLSVYINNNLLADSTYGISDVQHFDMSFPSTLLTSSNTLKFEHRQTGNADVFGVPYWSIDYPRDWDFSGSNFIKFKVNASTSAQYLEINNFVHGGTAPKLYDLTNNKWYLGDISISGKTRFLIDAAMTQSEMVLFANTSSKIIKPQFAQQRIFTNYNITSNQGDYLIITHKNLMKPYAGKNQIDEYKNYRNSVAGGAHQTVVADVEELYDQFAYGTDQHPLAITHLIDFGLANWSTKPTSVFLIGKGVTYEIYKTFIASSSVANYEGIVPTYGTPGSDLGFVTDRVTWKMKMPIGRLSAWNTEEVANYLNKVKQYEASLAPASFPTPSTELWKKQVLHLAGGDGTPAYPGLQSGTLLPTLNAAKSIIEAPNTGAFTATYAKDTKGDPTTINDKKVDSLINNGISMITYYGHGSAERLDYEIKAPSEYNTLPRIPIFSAFGCDISTIYKTKTTKTITETYISAPNSGSIIAMASNNQGYTNIHSLYIPIMYAKIAKDNYGQTIGEQYKAAHDSCIVYGAETPYQTSFKQTHMESFILQGDPATRGTFGAAKPDYYVGADEITTTPNAINTNIDSFVLSINAFNLGRTLNDTVNIKVEHINPDGKTSTIKSFSIYELKSISSNSIWVKIDKTKDLGLNKYKVSIDFDNKYDEISEANNVAIRDVFILSDNIVPIYPFNFSIVHNPDVTLKASTLNPFKGISKYRIEIDTTELFNSPSKQTTSISSSGGVIKWKPTIVWQDSMVYYWRTSLDSQINGNYIWGNSSFIYLQNGSDGWNQSHYYQYLYNGFDSLKYDASRRFGYLKTDYTLQNINTVMWLPSPPYTTYNTSEQNRVYLNNVAIQRNSCGANGGSIIVFVIDTLMGKAAINSSAGDFGSLAPCYGTNEKAYTFPIETPAQRDNARKFIDAIPDGNYVLIRNHINYNLWGHYYVNTWKNDTLTYGSGNSLYHSIRNLGFNSIDSFNQLRLFSLFRKKGYTDFDIKQDWTKDTNEIMDVTYTFPITSQDGRMDGIEIGPASTWKTLKWRTSNKLDTATASDSASVIINGINSAGSVAKLYEGNMRDLDLGFINAVAYPKLKLEWYSTDTNFHTAPQLDFWRILYDPLPEAALNPTAHYSFTDSVSVGQLMNLETAIETLTDKPMDSMLVRYKVIDANGVQHLLADKKYRKLLGNDTLHADISFDPKPYPGKNYLFVEANPDNNQPEQYHPNNLGYVPFEIKTDEYAPVLDVTFDGIHILDRDIVSSKPYIKVLLRDENKFLALNDTSSMKVFLKYLDEPAAPKERIGFDGTICKFIPANIDAGKNEANIEYRPSFMKDGFYQLYVEGTDMSGNESGQGNQYSISFEVVSKSTITNLLNYPNPFSTSTAFVFTLTGSQIPSQFKIQILSVTGKVVREITKQELGPIHIGRNITEYKWDGKDQYGQTLGNGVYLYRVVTTINGENIERRSNNAVDKFNKNGYTKMYIMR